MIVIEVLPQLYSNIRLSSNSYKGMIVINDVVINCGAKKVAIPIKG